jgi:hypothetical protein
VIKGLTVPERVINALTVGKVSVNAVTPVLSVEEFCADYGFASGRFYSCVSN